MSHPDPSKVCYDICELCGEEINDLDDIQYPHGHHGDAVQCLKCYSSANDLVYEGLKPLKPKAVAPEGQSSVPSKEINP